MQSDPLKINEAARYLHIGRSLLYKTIQKREIATVKIGKRRLIRTADLDEYIARVTVPERSEP